MLRIIMIQTKIVTVVSCFGLVWVKFQLFTTTCRIFYYHIVHIFSWLVIHFCHVRTMKNCVSRIRKLWTSSPVSRCRSHCFMQSYQDTFEFCFTTLCFLFCKWILYAFKNDAATSSPHPCGYHQEAYDRFFKDLKKRLCIRIAVHCALTASYTNTNPDLLNLIPYLSYM